MDLNDVKALIKSILVTSTTPYSVPKLKEVFEKEAGVKMPTFNFKTVKAFLRSLPDTVKFVGESPYEKIVAVASEKTQHISSLIKRQREGRYKEAYSHSDKFLPENPFEHYNESVPEEPKCYGKSKSKSYSINNNIPERVRSEKAPCDITYEDFVFKEDEINNLNKHPGSDSSLKIKSPNKPQNCDNTGFLSPSNIPLNSCCVNENVKNKLKKLMEKQTQGMWCSDLPDLYKDSYSVTLEYKEFGYRSLIDMVMESSDIFRCVRPRNGDWLLFDASKPPSQEEVDMVSASQCTIPEYVEKNMLQLIESHCENGFNHGVYLDDLLVLYFKKFRQRLNFAELGFPNIKSLLTKLDGHILRLEKEDCQFIIKPIVERNAVKQDIAVFPITPEDDFFMELFPEDVVKRGENIPKLKIENYFKVGEKVDVVVADVWSPDKFYVQLKEYEDEFYCLNESLQGFYNRNVNKYKMPDATIQPNQVCVVLFNNGEGYDEWNRSVIVQLTKPNEVLVHFVDYGDRVKTNVKKLRFLHRDFFHLPAQSFHGKLSFVKPPSGNVWPLEACRKFLELVKVPSAKFHVKSIEYETETITGVVISINGNKRIDVGKALVKEKMAVHNDMKLKNFKLLGNKSVVCKDPTKEMIEDELLSDFVETDKPPVRFEKFLEVNNADILEIGGTTLNAAADGDIQPCDKSEEISVISESPIVVNTPPPGYLNTSKAELCHRLEKDTYALAFWIVSTDQFVKEVAAKDLDNGLQLALNFARLVTKDGNCNN